MKANIKENLKTNNAYSGFSYPKALLEVFSKMKVGETINRDDLIKSIWKVEPDWFIRRSFDVARTNSIKGTSIKLQSRKGIITKLN